MNILLHEIQSWADVLDESKTSSIFLFDLHSSIVVCMKLSNLTSLSRVVQYALQRALKLSIKRE
jgi:hypothetical protein